MEKWGWKDGIVSEGYSYPHYPRVAVNLERFRSAYGKYNGQTWEEYAQEYRDYILDTTFTSSNAELKRIVKGIEQKYSDDYARAGAVLQYVQENITVTTEGHRDTYAVNLDEVIKRKSGDYLEISVVLIEMLKMAQFDVNLYVSRSRIRGGFDPKLPGWGQLSLPLVSTVIDNKELIAFPFYKKASLGEYPHYFYNEKALELESGKIVALPGPSKNKHIFTSDVTLSKHEGMNDIDWKCSLKESMSFISRDYLLDYNEEEQKRYWKTIIRKFDELHVAKGQPVLTLQRGEPVWLQGKVENQNVSVVKSGTEYVNLGAFFREYFQKVEDARTQSYTNDLELLYVEKVTLPKRGHAKIIYEFQCEDQDNILFRSECSTDMRNEKNQLTRKVTFKKVSIPAESWGDYAGEINKLNEISKSHMIRKI